MKGPSKIASAYTAWAQILKTCPAASLFFLIKCQGAFSFKNTLPSLPKATISLIAFLSSNFSNKSPTFFDIELNFFMNSFSTSSKSIFLGMELLNCLFINDKER